MFRRIDRCSTQVSTLLYMGKPRTLWAYGAMVGKLGGKSLPEEVTSRYLCLFFAHQLSSASTLTIMSLL